ncbi:phage head closure protein [Pacificoceanicola onchidii]|uniref:phage head closure protein n=1 Tax=Pacificoceanicola onchidii TaxID=2562685 RepID=UPI0010A32394|nr:phage head closure protein [Pacificoceanicola onchidii]
MAKHLQAGDFDRRAAFLSQETADDGYGNKIATGLTKRFTLWANLYYLRGGEEVLASRLQGRQPVLISVKVSSLSRQILSDWHCEIDGVRYALKEPPRPAQRNSILQFLAEVARSHG